jgi:hypothetical protein
MDLQTFTNKIATRPSNIKNIPISTPLSRKISKELLNQIYPLNFSGIYRIGSKSCKEDCYISSSYNIGKTVREHINLLIANKHYSKALQDWVNENGINKLSVTILKWCSSYTNLAKQLEEIYINLYEPNFNLVKHEPNITKEEQKDKLSSLRPTYVLVDENDEIIRIKQTIMGITINKPVIESVVIRNNIFKPKPST